MPINLRPSDLRDVFLYIVFGVLTTIANIVVFWFAAHPLHASTAVSTVAAWVVTVTLAWLTNRVWVFHSRASSFIEIIKEVVSFYICRIATGIADLIIMLMFVDLLQMNDIITKTSANIVVIVLNYAASKFIIFRT